MATTSIRAPLGASPSSAIENLPAAPAQNWSASTEWKTTAKVAALRLASYLTDPLCKVREYFYTFSILDKICDTTLQKIAKIAFLTLGIVVCSFLAPLTAPVGAAIRGIVAAIQSESFVFWKGDGEGKVLPQNREITLVSHNVCYMPGGYSITDGQVTPPSDKERIDANIAKIKELDPDVVCLYEVPDICDASYISSQLPEYPFIIPVAGVRAIGPSSMMYIASKYEIARDSIEFSPFEKGTELTGRSQFSEKGCLSFDLKSRGEQAPIATIFSTHLQHSEISERPEEIERLSRAAQMNRIIGKIEQKIRLGRNVIFTGDLNQDEEEINTFLNQRQIAWLRRDPQVQGQPTWGGDAWCANLMNKPASAPLVLDYAWIAGRTREITTRIIETGYASSEFRRRATSDHSLLFSRITLG